MHWILDNNMFKEDGYHRMVEVLERFNIPHSFHKTIPFVGKLTPEPELDTNNVICFGTYSMRHYAAMKGWYPGVFDVEQQDFLIQREHWGDLMLNTDSKVCHFEEVKFNDNELLFIRPIHDSKVFAGGLFEKKEFEEWQHKVCILDEDFGNSLDRKTYVQVCAPKKIFAEYRFWVVDQEIITYSQYKRGDRVIYSDKVDTHVINFANQVLRTKNQQCDISTSIRNNGWRPDDAFVLDVCETPNGMKVVEINTLNSSGFYAGNMTDLVLAIEQKFKR